jgi:hypothetical protein
MRDENTTGNTPRCVTPEPLRMAKALEALALQWSFPGDKCFHLRSQAAQFRLGMYFSPFWTSRQRHNKVRSWGVGLCGFLS